MKNTTKLTGTQITALKHKFRQLLKDAVKHQHAHYELQRKATGARVVAVEKAINDLYAPRLAAIDDKIDALCKQKRTLEETRNQRMRAEVDRIAGPAPRFGYYDVDRRFDELWADLNFRLQFAATHDAATMAKLLSDEVVRLLNAKE
jgi:hypothetical protein